VVVSNSVDPVTVPDSHKGNGITSISSGPPGIASPNMIMVTASGSCKNVNRGVVTSVSLIAIDADEPTVAGVLAATAGCRRMAKSC